MAEKQAQPQGDEGNLLSFWALGDLHYNSPESWQELHERRMSILFQDLRQLWGREGWPAFVVSPGDIVEEPSPDNYQLALSQLNKHLGQVPFYPGLGNHEMLAEGVENAAETLAVFHDFWKQAPRYFWVESGVLCVMLDVRGYPRPALSAEALTFLEMALHKFPRHPAIIFAHCPLYNTVLAREADEEQEEPLDYESRHPFFSLSNSSEVRAQLGQHQNVCLYISGHTHSFWKAPGLVLTEDLGGHPVTHVNLSSPWYTGRHHGADWDEAAQRYSYRPDQTDLILSFGVQVQREQILLRLRDHSHGSWLREWTLPLR